MSDQGNSTDWLGRIIAFICGALAGVLGGFSLWGGTAYGWLFIPLTSILMGILSANFGYEFWKRIHWWI